jgi:hypothetical protein
MAPEINDKPLLDPPTFKLPSDFEENPDDYEIWSLRVPVRFDMASLNGTILNLNLPEKEKKGKETGVTSFEIGEEKYSLNWGSSAETENIRILTALEDDDDENEKAMIPSKLQIKNHFNLVHIPNSKTKDIDLAPSLERAPQVDMPAIQMRIPYSKIDQVKGLKRRWQAPGASAEYTPPVESIHNEMNKDESSPSKTKNGDKHKKEAKSHKKKKRTKSE